MRKAIMIACIWTIATTLWAATIAKIDFAESGDIKAWRHKVNTEVSVVTDSPKEGRAALRYTVETSKWTFGWIHCKLPQADYAKAGGVHGWYRCNPAATGKVISHLVLYRNGQPGAYFVGDVGTLSGAATEWTEFYIPFSQFKYSSGPIKRFTPADLTTSDILQFMTQTGSGAEVSVDLDGVGFISPDEAEAIYRRIERRKMLALLEPISYPDPAPHPRLFLTDDAVAQMRKRAKSDEEYGAAWQALVKMAESGLKSLNADDPMEPVFQYVEKNKNADDRRAFSGGFEGVLGNQSRPIKVLAAAYRLTGDKRFGEHGAKALTNAARRFTVDVKFQDKGFYYTRTLYVRNIAFAYDWLYDMLTPEQRKEVQMTLVGYIRNIYDNSWVHSWGDKPLRRVWNWDPGLVGACGVAMLALENETALPQESILFTCRRHMRDYLTLGVGRDGSGNEGPGYIGYGIGTGVEYVDLLRRRGLDDLFVGTNYDIIAPWIASEMLPGGKRWNNLSDCNHGARPWPVYIYALSRLGQLAKADPFRPSDKWPVPDSIEALPYLAHFSEVPGDKRMSYGAHAALMGWAWNQGIGGSSPDGYGFDSLIAWLIYQPELMATDDPAKILPLGAYFRGRGLVVLRTGFGPDDIYMAVEAGPYAAGHDQSDKGTFNLFGYGADLAVDSGYGNTGDPKGSGSSYAHNVVLIDGEGQPMSYHNQSSGYISGFRHGAVADWVRADARDAWSMRYGRNYEHVSTSPVERAERQFVLARPSEGVPPYVVVLDDIQKDDKTHDYTWQWHIPASMKFEIGKGRWDSAAAVSNLTTALGSTLKMADGVTDPVAGGSATFTFQVKKAGKYVLLGMTRATGVDAGKSDSFFVSVNGGEDILWDSGSQRDFQWKEVVHRGESNPRVFDLPAGPLRVRIKKREPEAQIARLALAPEGEEGIQEVMRGEGGMVLDASEAVMDNPPLARFDIQEEARAEGTLAVWPVHPAGGETSEDWYMTTREGPHPRLHYTVKAVNPRFVFLLLPRKEGLPEPTKVEPLGDDGRGVRIEWPSRVVDTVYFGGSGDAQGAGDIRTDGSAAFVRASGGKVAQWAMYDGTKLDYAGRELASGASRCNMMSGE